jgi:asparagine synthase (glutamine-hydrolysing)
VGPEGILMCGIAGVWHPQKEVAQTAVLAMNQAQAHRGPNDEGSVTLPLSNSFLSLGHRRLSILDLSPAGHQPMQNPETGDWIVFNGEIYNYPELRSELEAAGTVFRSHSDTEVILHAFQRWKTAAFDRLQGMFALALFSKANERLFLVRDPLGIKPLYYAWNRDCFVFASELRALTASNLIETDVDRRALASVLAYGAVPCPLTMLRGVRCLEPGTWTQLNLNTTTVRERHLQAVRFWDFPEVCEPGPDLREHVESLLVSATRSHLLSDVPVGVFLSSGLDSSAVATLCSEIRGGDIDTFTVSLGNDPHLDETPIAEETARRIGARHHAIQISETDVLKLAERWLDSLDRPSVDGLNTYLISHAVRQRGIVVALSGLGGDELFAGYSTFSEIPRFARLAARARWLPKPARAGLARVLFSTRTKAQRQKAVELANAEPSLQNFYFRRRRLLSDRELEALGFSAKELDLDENFLPPESCPDRVPFSGDSVASVSMWESRFYMGNMLLPDADVFGMAHGLEIRVPFLDRHLIDYLFSLPGDMRVAKNGMNKPLLVESLGKRIPPDLYRLKKRGFSLPQARWMAGPLRDLFEDRVANLKKSGLVNPIAVSSVWSDFLDEQQGPTWSRAWTLGILGTWLANNTPHPSNRKA